MHFRVNISYNKVYFTHHSCKMQILLVINKLHAEPTERKFTWDAGGARHRDHMGLVAREDASSLLYVCVRHTCTIIYLFLNFRTFCCRT